MSAGRGPDFEAQERHDRRQRAARFGAEAPAADWETVAGAARSIAAGLMQFAAAGVLDDPRECARVIAAGIERHLAARCRRPEGIYSGGRARGPYSRHHVRGLEREMGDGIFADDTDAAWYRHQEEKARTLRLAASGADPVGEQVRRAAPAAGGRACYGCGGPGADEAGTLCPACREAG